MRKTILVSILVLVLILVGCGTSPTQPECPTDAPYYWESDKLCHSTQETVTKETVTTETATKETVTTETATKETVTKETKVTEQKPPAGDMMWLCDKIDCVHISEEAVWINIEFDGELTYWTDKGCTVTNCAPSTIEDVPGIKREILSVEG